MELYGRSLHNFLHFKSDFGGSITPKKNENNKNNVKVLSFEGSQLGPDNTCTKHPTLQIKFNFETHVTQNHS